MSKWDALKCVIGRHDWTRWRYNPNAIQPLGYGKGQRRFCTRCGSAQTRPWQGRMRNHSTKEQPK